VLATGMITFILRFYGYFLWQCSFYGFRFIRRVLKLSRRINDYKQYASHLLYNIEHIVVIPISSNTIEVNKAFVSKVMYDSTGTDLGKVPDSWSWVKAMNTCKIHSD
jgi:hypothetical protein